MADHALAIDVGTQSVRAILFDPQGTLVAMGRVPIEPYVSPQPGWAEQDPEVWWTAIGEACRRLWASGGEGGDAGPRPDPSSVGGVGLTTQRVTLVVADEDGVPLRPAIVWLDQRRTEGLPPIGGLWGLSFRLAGVRDTVARFQADAEANWIERNEPAVWKRIRRYGVLSSWLTARLTGEWVDSTASQVGYLPFDFKRGEWVGRLDWKWRVAPFERAWLPRLVPPTGRLGELTPAAAAHLGVATGTPLIAAAGDKQCEALGAGAVQPDVAALSFGTTATIGTTHRRYVEAIPLVPPYPAAIPGAWLVELQVMRGFWMVEWFKREFGAAEVTRAAGLDIPPEALFEELLEASPPGAMGLVLQPYWMPGVRYPGPEAKGALLGFGDIHGRAHVYRAILEGLAYALREGAERTVRRSRVPIRELRISGGGSQSRAAVQLFADVFGLPASRPHTHEAAGLGAAIDVLLGLGVHADPIDAVAAMVRVTDRFEPDPAANRTYEDLYRSVYLPMYDRLKPLSREIRRITGYPPPWGIRAQKARACMRPNPCVIVNHMVQYRSTPLDASFAALSDTTRRGVLEQLGRADASITQLAERFDMTLTGMKKHVGVLELAGLVTTEKVGRVRTCRLGPRRLDEATAWIERYRELWAARFEELDKVVEALKKKETVNGRKQPD